MKDVMMTEHHQLAALFRDSNYKLTQFTDAQIAHLEQRIKTKDVRGTSTPHADCLVRRKEIKLTPEEAVRQR